jgi:hypothetical protein
MKLVCFLQSHFLPPAVNLIQNTQICYEIYSVLLPVCTVATDVKAMCK